LGGGAKEPLPPLSGEEKASLVSKDEKTKREDSSFRSRPEKPVEKFGVGVSAAPSVSRKVMAVNPIESGEKVVSSAGGLPLSEEGKKIPPETKPTFSNEPSLATGEAQKKQLEESVERLRSDEEPPSPLPNEDAAFSASPLPLPPQDSDQIPPAPQSPVSAFFSSLPKPVLFVAFGLLAVLLVVGLIRVIGGKKGGVTSKEVTLTYWGLWEPAPVVGGVIAQFEKDHPGIKIEYEMQSSRDYRPRLQNALKAGRGPDIFRLHQTWLATFASDLSPVPEAVKNELGLESNYFSSVKKALQTKDDYYALPLMVDNLALYYNKDLLAKAGGELPRTWWGLQQLASQLTERTEEGRIIVAGAALGTTNNVDHFSDILGLMLLQSGVDFAKPQTKTVEEVLEYYTLFTSKYRVWDETLRQSTDAFASGQLAFYFAPSWRYFEIKHRNPSLNFGITTAPQLPKIEGVDFEKAEKGEVELTNINWATFWIEGVSNQSKYQREAWEFLSYLASAEGLGNLYQAASDTRDFGEIYPIVSLAQELKENPYLAPFIQQAENADWWYLCSRTHDVTLNDGMIKYYQDAVNSILDGSSPSLVTETLAFGVEEVLQKMQIGE